MPAKDPLIYLMHIRDCCRRIAEYVAASGAEWTSNPLAMDAVCRNLITIGEAARKTDDSFRRAHPEIPWPEIIGARNVIIHGYEYVRPQLIREMAE
jgi:uncharacterized protein with HEPN domain